jgi:hypothetical protein
MIKNVLEFSSWVSVLGSSADRHMIESHSSYFFIIARNLYVILLLLYFILFLFYGVSHCLRICSLYVEFVGHELKALHHIHVYNGWLLYYILRTQFTRICMFVSYLYTEFHMLSSNCSLVIIVKTKIKKDICRVAMLLLHRLQNISLTIVALFRRCTSIIAHNFKTLC